MRKSVLIIFFVVFFSGILFAESDGFDVDLSKSKLYLKFKTDLRQGGLIGRIGKYYMDSSPYMGTYGLIGDYSGFIQMKYSLEGFELALSRLINVEYDFYITEDPEDPQNNRIRIDQRTNQSSPNLYLKYRQGDFFVAAGMMRDEISEGRFFTLPDILLVDREFENLNAVKHEQYLVDRIDRINLGYSGDFIFIDMKVLPDGRKQIGTWSSLGWYGRIGIKASDFKLSLYGYYKELGGYYFIQRELAGINISFKLNNYLFYLETKAKCDTETDWTLFLETVLGARLMETDGYSIVFENYYATRDVYKLFLEGEKKDVFGWDSWDANIAVLYSPSEFNNFRTFVTMRKNWDKNWLSEFRYGYESAGNHIIDASIRWYEL